MIITENGDTIYLVKDEGVYKRVDNLEQYHKLQEPLRRKFREMQDAKNNKSN